MFSTVIKQLRIEKGYKQEEMAKKLFVSRAVISRWENGTQYPNAQQLIQISHEFQISIDELLGNDDYVRLPEVSPIMDSKEENDIEMGILIGMAFLYFVKLLFDVTIKYNPSFVDWLLEDIVFIPVLIFTAYKSHKKEASPKVIGFMFIYLMISSMGRSIYLYKDVLNKVGFRWVDLYYEITLILTPPINYCVVILLFYTERKNRKGESKIEKFLCWISVVMVIEMVRDAFVWIYNYYGIKLIIIPLILYCAVVLLFYTAGKDVKGERKSEKFIYMALIMKTMWYFGDHSLAYSNWFVYDRAYDEHFIYGTVAYLTNVLKTVLMIMESTKLRKKRKQVKESVSV